MSQNVRIRNGRANGTVILTKGVESVVTVEIDDAVNSDTNRMVADIVHLDGTDLAPGGVELERVAGSEYRIPISASVAGLPGHINAQIREMTPAGTVRAKHPSREDLKMIVEASANPLALSAIAQAAAQAGTLVYPNNVFVVDGNYATSTDPNHTDSPQLALARARAAVAVAGVAGFFPYTDSGNNPEIRQLSDIAGYVFQAGDEKIFVNSPFVKMLAVELIVSTSGTISHAVLHNTFGPITITRATTGIYKVTVPGYNPAKALPIAAPVEIASGYADHVSASNDDDGIYLKSTAEGSAINAIAGLYVFAIQWGA